MNASTGIQQWMKAFLLSFFSGWGEGFEGELTTKGNETLLVTTYSWLIYWERLTIIAKIQGLFLFISRLPILVHHENKVQVRYISTLSSDKFREFISENWKIWSLSLRVDIVNLLCSGLSVFLLVLYVFPSSSILFLVTFLSSGQFIG